VNARIAFLNSSPKPRILIDAELVRELWSIRYNYFGSVSAVLFESPGEVTGRVLRKRIGLKRFNNVKDTLEYLKNVMNWWLRLMKELRARH
jgi:hypothetical protein